MLRSESRLCDVAAPSPYRRPLHAGVVHFGPGAFHRAHQAYFFDRLLVQDDRWGVCAVSLRSSAVRDALTPQDGLYTLVELGDAPWCRVIGTIVEMLVASEDPAAVIARLAAETTHSVTITVTEKGYAFDETGSLDLKHPDIRHDLAHPDAPVSLIGFLVAGLRRRARLRLPGLTVLSCDNLPSNGRALGRAVMAFAGQNDEPLAQWIGRTCDFPDTMVDSITPATDDALRDLVVQQTGLTDAWPVQREPFVQWVIGDRLPAMQRAALESVGVIVTPEVAGYERMKLRLLNAAHSALAYVGLRRGYVTVSEAMGDTVLAAAIETLMRDEIAPLLAVPTGADVNAYIATIMARFRNPGIRHRLTQIAADGSQKLPVRIVPSIDAARVAGAPHRALLGVVTAWMHYVVTNGPDGIDDPLRVALLQIAAASTGRPAHDVAAFLNLDGVFPAAWRDDQALIGDLAAAWPVVNALDPIER